MKGFKLWVNSEDKKSYWLGTYEPMIEKALIQHIQPGMIAYDLGANFGYFSLLMARLCTSEGKVFAFEPISKICERLSQNVNLNNLNQIEVKNCAVSDTCGDGFMKEGISNTTAHLLKAPTDKSLLVKVPVTTLDHFVYEDGNPPPSILKIDVESFEGPLLQCVCMCVCVCVCV